MIQPRPTLSGRQTTNRRIVTNAEFAPKNQESECHIRQSAWGPCKERWAPIMSGSEGQTASMQERWRALWNRDSALKEHMQTLTYAESQHRSNNVKALYWSWRDSWQADRKLVLPLRIQMLETVIWGSLLYHEETGVDKCHLESSCSLLILGAFPPISGPALVPAPAEPCSQPLRELPLPTGRVAPTPDMSIVERPMQFT